MEILKKIQKDDSGAVAILSLLGIMVVLLSVAAVTSHLAVSELKMMRGGGVIDQTYYAAESGLNDALRRQLMHPSLGTYGLEIAGVEVVVEVDPDPSDPYRRIITATASNLNGNRRAVRVNAETNIWAGGFDYAVQGGAGGVEMNNGSCVIGDVYSSGDMVGPGENNNGCKTNSSCRPAYAEKHSIISRNEKYDGKVEVSGLNEISGVANTSDLMANTIKNSVAGKKAYYQSLSGTVKAEGGEVCGVNPGINCFPGSPDPAVKDFPIREDPDINNWKNQISSVLPLNCRRAAGPGPNDTYCVSGNQTLGNIKIEGDFYMDINADLSLNGNIWVTGKIVFNNNGNLRAHSSLGDASVIVIADGTVEVSNNLNISGNGNSHSFIMLISTSNSLNSSNPAILAANNSDSIIFATLNGLLKVENNGCLNAAMAHRIELSNNSTVIFNPNLSAFIIPDGSANFVNSDPDTWQEL